MILVTGGFGFIGSHLVEELLERGERIHVVDNLSTAAITPGEFIRQTRPLDGRLSYDICSVQDYCRRRRGGLSNVEQIYHLASPVGPAGILKHAGQMARQIIDDADCIVNLTLLHKSQLVFVSTSEVYGGGQAGLCREDMPMIVPAESTVRLEYGVGKLAAEIAVMNTCRVSPLDASIIRPFNVAGPRQSEQGGFVLPRFVRQARSDEPLTVFGDGSQIRAFTHVKDIVDGLIRTAERGQPATIYNLGNEANRISILDLAKAVIRLTGSKSPIAHVDPRSIYGELYAEAADKYPDSFRAMTELDWQPSRDIDSIIRDVIEEQRACLSPAIN